MPEEVVCEWGKPPLHLRVVWFAAQQFLHAELQLLFSMHGLGFRGQGDLRVSHFPLIFPKSPSENDFLWIWHNYLLLLQRDATFAHISNCHRVEVRCSAWSRFTISKEYNL